MYLTHSINADISFVVRARGAVFDLAGHGEEEVKIFCIAVQLTDVFICTHNIRIYALIQVSIKNVIWNRYGYCAATCYTYNMYSSC